MGVTIRKITSVRMNMTDNETPTVTTIATPTKILGETSINAEANLFTMSANNRLQYIGGTTQKFSVEVSITWLAAINNMYRFYLAKNDIIQSISAGGSGNVQGSKDLFSNTSLQLSVELNYNDYIELWAASLDANEDILNVDFNMKVMLEF